MKHFCFVICFLAMAITGCGSKDSPQAGSTVTPVVTNSSDPWQLEADKLVVPEKPAGGKLGGVAFQPDVTLETKTLSFRVGKDFFADQEITIALAEPPLPGKTIVVKVDDAFGVNIPTIMVATRTGNDLPKTNMVMNGYAMTLSFGPKEKGELPGKIYLCLPGEDKNYLAGTFRAKVKRANTEPPTELDAPFVQGTVDTSNLVGDNVLVGFVGVSEENKTISNSVGINLTPSAYASSTTFEPQITSMFVVNEKQARFEHTKLPPGRYLVYAAIRGKALTWKWVDIKANAQVTETLAFTQTVGGTVTVKGVKSENGFDTVNLVPADPTGKITDLSFYFSAGFALKQEGKIVDGTATLTNVAPGEYIVCGAKKYGTVTVEAGKTATLDVTTTTPTPEKK